MRLHIDTGSSDLWVNTPSSRICSSQTDPCALTGTYNPNSSSTYNYVSSDFNVSYVDGTAALGDYVTDNVAIGGASLQDLQFGIGYRSTTSEAILGIGYTIGEAQVNRNGGQPYPNIPQAMADAGLINTNAYSIWLDDLASSTGSILFGGIDSDKYTGTLQTLPVQRDAGQYRAFVVTLSGLNLNENGQSSSFSTELPVPAILDTGTTLTYLPVSLVSDIYDSLDIQYSRREGIGYTSCDRANDDATLDFTFSSVTISVPMSELIINPNEADDGSGNPYESEESFCLFGITATEDDSFAVLGDTFLRSAYVVFDLENNEISLAQTNFDSNTTNVAEIGSGSSAIPGATSASKIVEATATATGARVATGTSTSASNALQVPPWLTVASSSIAFWSLFF